MFCMLISLSLSLSLSNFIIHVWNSIVVGKGLQSCIVSIKLDNLGSYFVTVNRSMQTTFNRNHYWNIGHDCTNLCELIKYDHMAKNKQVTMTLFSIHGFSLSFFLSLVQCLSTTMSQFDIVSNEVPSFRLSFFLSFFHSDGGQLN